MQYGGHIGVCNESCTRGGLRGGGDVVPNGFTYHRLWEDWSYSLEFIKGVYHGSHDHMTFGLAAG